MTIQMEQAHRGPVLLEAQPEMEAFEFPVTRRGYETGAVQAYVAASSVELRHLADTNRSLLQRVTDLEQRLAASEAAADAAVAAAARMAAAAPPPPPAIEATPARSPLFATKRSSSGAVEHDVADPVVASARDEAERILAAARARADEILREADAQVVSKRAALVGGLGVLQQAIGRALDDLSAEQR